MTHPATRTRRQTQTKKNAKNTLVSHRMAAAAAAAGPVMLNKAVGLGHQCVVAAVVEVAAVEAA
jgi:hypothetical protein